MRNIISQHFSMAVQRSPASIGPKWSSTIAATGRPKVVCFTVMQGMPNRQGPPYAAAVSCTDEATGRVVALPLAGPGLAPRDKAARWRAFARAALAHMKARGLAKSLWWGYPLEGEADPGLKDLLAAAAPGVY